MKFINRKRELKQLSDLSNAGQGGLAVLWGRRRVGKTRLLLEWARRDGLYLACDESAPSIQRAYIAQSIASRFDGFNKVNYPDWQSLFDRLAEEARRNDWCGPVIFDELPYLVVTSGEVPSLLQRWVDHAAKNANLILAVAGSCQRMMQGIVLDRSAPLYGRATVSMQIKPFMPGYLPEVFKLSDGLQAVMAYSVWGGIPRYWELAVKYGADLSTALDELVLSPLGVLHNEVDTLLASEVPPAGSLRSLLDAIGMGAHRLSEIAGRLGQPATSLSRPLGNLIEMDIVRREVPFGESERSSKRSLYKITDSFIRFWFMVVAQYRSLLTDSGGAARKRIWNSRKTAVFSATWEDLCRDCVCHLRDDHQLGRIGPWQSASRFWKGNSPEWDVVSLSLDKQYLMLGEVKWMETTAGNKEIAGLFASLQRKKLPDIVNFDKYKVIYTVFVPRHNVKQNFADNCFVVDADDVMSSLHD